MRGVSGATPESRPGFGGCLVVWAQIQYRAILSTLHHPFYAGAICSAGAKPAVSWTRTAHTGWSPRSAR